jgi:hypothetical protein
VAYVGISQIFTRDSHELLLEDKQDFEPLITAYNSGINYRKASGGPFSMEMVVSSKMGIFSYREAHRPGSFGLPWKDEGQP